MKDVDNKIETINGNNGIYDNCYNDYSTTNNDYSTTTNNYSTTNIHYNFNNENINDRINLKDRLRKGVFEYEMFCIGVNEKLKKEDNFIMVTCVNIHSKYQFVSDHVHVKFLAKEYGDAMKYNLIKVRGFVYEYTRKDGSKDYGIQVNKTLDFVNRLPYNITRGCYCLVNKNRFNENFNVIERLLIDIPKEQLYDIVNEQLDLLDSTLTTNCNITNQGFVKEYIMTRYFLNTKIQSQTYQTNALYKSNKEVLIDMLQLLSYILYEINNGEIFTWRHIMNKINLFCNYKHGIIFDISEDIDKQRKRIISNNILEFKNKIKEITKNKIMFGLSRAYNKNIGYHYPTDIDKFKYHINEACFIYLYTKGFIKY